MINFHVFAFIATSSKPFQETVAFMMFHNNKDFENLSDYMTNSSKANICQDGRKDKFDKFILHVVTILMAWTLLFSLKFKKCHVIREALNMCNKIQIMFSTII